MLHSRSSAGYEHNLLLVGLDFRDLGCASDRPFPILRQRSADIYHISQIGLTLKEKYHARFCTNPFAIKKHTRKHWSTTYKQTSQRERKDHHILGRKAHLARNFHLSRHYRNQFPNHLSSLHHYLSHLHSYLEEEVLILEGRVQIIYQQRKTLKTRIRQMFRRSFK